jgi:hypothetical protein
MRNMCTQLPICSSSWRYCLTANALAVMMAPQPSPNPSGSSSITSAAPIASTPPQQQPPALLPYVRHALGLLRPGCSPQLGGMALGLLSITLVHVLEYHQERAGSAQLVGGFGRGWVCFGCDNSRLELVILTCTRTRTQLEEVAAWLRRSETAEALSGLLLQSHSLLDKVAAGQDARGGGSGGMAALAQLMGMANEELLLKVWRLGIMVVINATILDSD